MSSTSELQNLLDDGRYEMMNGNLEKGIECFSELLRQEPDNKLALISRGSAFLKLNRIGEAVKDFDRTIDMYPNYARAYHLRGIVREKDGDNDGALDDFSKAIEFDPEYGAAYFSRGTLLTKMKQEDKALEDIQMVQHLTHKNIETFANENNVWRSQQLRLESVMESELER